jgi:hypothetical protein
MKNEFMKGNESLFSGRPYNTFIGGDFLHRNLHPDRKKERSETAEELFPAGQLLLVSVYILHDSVPLHPAGKVNEVLPYLF